MRTVVALVVSLAALSLAAPAAAWASSADASADGSGEYDVDLGQKWSMKIQFMFAGSDAASVEWDFGDGSPVSTEWNPLHEYPAEGVYYGSQTARNSYDPDGEGEGSSDVLRFRVEVMGYPEITFDSAGGSPVETMCQTSYGAAAEKPEDPVLEGRVFTGWYLDGEAFDWTQPIRRDIALVAGWDVLTHSVVFVDSAGAVVSEQTVAHGEMPDLSGIGRDGSEWSVAPEVSPATGDATYVVTYSVPGTGDDGGGGDGTDVLPMILIAAGAALAVVGFRRGAPAALPGIALAALGGLELGSVIDLLPELMV